jgi:hypothetical protein
MSKNTRCNLIEYDFAIANRITKSVFPVDFRNFPAILNQLRVNYSREALKNNFA